MKKKTNNLKNEISKIKYSLLQNAWKQGFVAESLGVSAAIVSLLKQEKYNNNLGTYLSSGNGSSKELYADF